MWIWPRFFPQAGAGQPLSHNILCAIATITLLASCSSMSGAAPPATKIIQNSQEITPISSIRKNGLSVSYSLKSFDGDNEQLLRLSLIFRSYHDGEKYIRPHVRVVDAQGIALDAYNWSTFGRTRGRDSGKTAAHDMEAYWLKRSYRIPPEGIAMGELVYHGAHIDYPLRVYVQVGADTFAFPAAQR